MQDNRKDAAIVGEQIGERRLHRLGLDLFVEVLNVQGLTGVSWQRWRLVQFSLICGRSKRRRWHSMHRWWRYQGVWRRHGRTEPGSGRIGHPTIGTGVALMIRPTVVKRPVDACVPDVILARWRSVGSCPRGLASVLRVESVEFRTESAVQRPARKSVHRAELKVGRMLFPHARQTLNAFQRGLLVQPEPSLSLHDIHPSLHRFLSPFYPFVRQLGLTEGGSLQLAT